MNTPLVQSRLKLEKAQRDYNKALSNMTGEMWKEAIDSIANSEDRIVVANIVFWDYFGSRKVADRWPHLDAYLLEYQARKPKMNKKAVSQALIDIGYLRNIAQKRLLIKD